MTEESKKQTKPAGKSARIVRMLLIVALVLVAGVAARWHMLLREYRKGVALYDEGKYQEAHGVLEELVEKPLAALRIRSQARTALGRCKAEVASDVVFKERSLEGYTKALKLLEEAKELVGPSTEIERRIREYGE